MLEIIKNEQSFINKLRQFSQYLNIIDKIGRKVKVILNLLQKVN